MREKVLFFQMKIDFGKTGTFGAHLLQKNTPSLDFDKANPSLYSALHIQEQAKIFSTKLRG
jgi:hypothetical protein